ncbi:hypothetical protein ARZXY2_4901 (plasmid) [Arthrobacter sp. ZXY-2]|nr:hypothetical protein ARZXY2_4901 [Arthrobacter sp. ZXY-2]
MKSMYVPVIWLNGPPGAGKSRLQADLCAEGWGEAVSAEQIGQNLQSVVPVKDYQNLPCWPRFVTRSILSCESTAIIDMTCVNRRVRKIYQSVFEKTGIQAVEIGLTASPEVLENRVLSRGGPGSAWCMSNLHRLRTGWADLARPTIDTSTMSENEVLEGVTGGLRRAAWPLFG